MSNVLEPHTGQQTLSGEPGTKYILRNELGTSMRITVVGLTSGTKMSVELTPGAELAVTLGSESIDIKLQDPDVNYVRPTLVKQ